MAITPKPKKPAPSATSAAEAFIAAAPDAVKKKAPQGRRQASLYMDGLTCELLDARAAELGQTKSKFAELAVLYCIERKIGLGDLFTAAEKLRK